MAEEPFFTNTTFESHHKRETVFQKVQTIPTTIYVEGQNLGQAQLSVILRNPPGREIHRDTVLFTVMRIDAQAYRPQTEGPGYGNPFAKTAVPFSQEFNPGVGIRRNGDDDNNDNVPDNQQNQQVVGENDLIEVELLNLPFPTPAGIEYVLSRSNNNIQVWDGRDKTLPLLVGQDNRVIATASSSMIVWVEWIGGNPAATATLSFEARAINTGNVVITDTLTFYPFTSVVIALGGNTQVPSDPPDPNHGAFLMAKTLYQGGYDVHMFKESQVEYAQGIVYDEVVDAIRRRGVSAAAIFGYSQGAGATHKLAKGLNDNAAAIGGFVLGFTAYIDGVQHTGPFPIADRPPGSQYHVNYYQNTPSPFNGTNGNAPLPGFEIDVGVAIWGVFLDHSTIDDHLTVRTRILAHIIHDMSRETIEPLGDFLRLKG